MDPALVKLLMALGIAEEQAIQWARDTAAKFPDGADRLAEIERLIREAVEPNLNLDAIKNSVTGIIKDIATGMTTIDPDAWASSG